MSISSHVAFRWLGHSKPCLDVLDVTRCGHVVIGCYGGTKSSGATKNEDAALVWSAEDASWTVAALLDAHGSSESAALVLDRISELESDVVRLMEGSYETTVPPFWDLSRLVTAHLSDETFRAKCALVHGEIALLLCAQKGAYLWLSVGDIPVYLFHPDFARLGQFALNQRMFFEWIGQVNTFALPVPCYAMGVRQLRTGTNRILMTTDGLLECGTQPFETPSALYDLFNFRTGAGGIEDAVGNALATVHTERGRDSATLIAWLVEVLPFSAMMQPSA